MKDVRVLESPFVNLKALDDLVSSHARDKDKGCALAQQLQDNLAGGNMQEVHSLVQENPKIFKDPVLNFRIECQRFIELLRDEKQKAEAFVYLRKVLTPSALDAYPEAYTDLKAFLLALIYTEGTDESPVAELWTEMTRHRLAGQCCRFVQQVQGFTDTKLVMLLKYLALSAQSLLDARPAIVSSETVSTITEALNSLGLFGIIQSQLRKPTPNAPSVEAAIKDEHIDALAMSSHIQIMMMKSMFELTREETIRSIKQGDCRIEQTLKNELTALPHQQPVIDSLAQEYLSYRGIDDHDESRTSEQIETANTAEFREPSAIVSEHFQDRCSLQAMRKAQQRNASCSPPKKLPRSVVPCNTSELEECSVPSGPPLDSPSAAKQSGEPVLLTGDIQTVRFLGNMLRSGSIADAISIVNQLDSSFLKEAANLHYQLQAAVYKQHLSTRNVPKAIDLLRTVITPLVLESQDPKLKQQSRDLTSLLLLDSTEPPNLESLANSLEEALCERFGVQPCSLICLLKTLMAAHTCWLESQVSPDYFGKYLGLEELQTGKLVENPPPLKLPGTAISVENDADSPMADKEQDGDAAPGTRGTLSESTISDAMDITNLSRAVVIPMLLDAGNDLQVLLERLFENGGEDGIDNDGSD